MEEKWKIIKEWVNLTPLQQLLSVLAAIIIVLSLVIIHYENKLTLADDQHRRDIDSLNTRHNIVVTTYQTKLDLCVEGHAKYVENNEKEMRDILFSVDKIKERQNQVNKNIK